MFSSSSFIVSGLTFRSLIHFEFVFMYDVRECSNFILLHIAVQFPRTTYWRDCFSSLYIFACFVKDKVSMEVKVKVSQWCLTLYDPMDYTVHRILQARILEWVAFPFSRGSSQPRDQTQVSCTAGAFFKLSHQGSPRILEQVACPFSSGSSQPGIEPGSPALQAVSLPAELPGKSHSR